MDIGQRQVGVGLGRREDGEAADLSRAVEPPVSTSSSSAGSCRACWTHSAASRRSPRPALNLFASATIEGWAFDLEILALARCRGFAIEEVGIEWKDDGNSRVNQLTAFWKVIREALTIPQSRSRRLRHDEFGWATGR
jgi:hypothetical protein